LNLPLTLIQWKLKLKLIAQFQGARKLKYLLDASKNSLLIKIVFRYKEVDIKNFTTSWKDGLAFNAIIHYYRYYMHLRMITYIT